jgi:F0F1-type ATP synthase epsilon subunit
MYKGKWLPVDGGKARVQSDGILILTDDMIQVHISSSVLEKLKEQEWEWDQQGTRRK